MSRKSQPPDREPEAKPIVDTRAGATSEAADPQSEPVISPELNAAREEARENFARYQRLYADFENFKRRTRQDLAERTQYANEELLRRLLPLLDNFRRLLEHAPPGVDEQWFEGVKLVAKQFEDILAQQGLAPISALGEKFDPSQHEAIAREETDEQEEGTVLEE